MIPRELFKKIRQIEIRTRGLVHDIFGGEYHSAFKGQGIEFSEVRPYQIGDDIRTIDWNVSARSGETYVKIFEEEREQTLMLLVDVSGSEDFGSKEKFKREVAAEICAVAAFSAIQNNDKVGLLLFTDRVERFVPPKKGRRHVLRLIRDLFAHTPQSTGTNLSVALQHALHVLRRRSIVLIVSDFFDDGFEPALRALARRHDTVAIHLQDPREEELPAVGLVELTDPETGETVLLDTWSRSARRVFAEQAYARRQRTAGLLRRLHVDHVPIRTDEGYVEPLIRFFRHRNRKGR
ncbi:DUF58 domain-containing protein [Rhodocaloribacter litoris]|uniref:DUF58 domain-containing protein n=1 Tax=Rhodocaloribacter litoris TaxID=2558931 RepID=UPI0014246CDB|nr:DUF58 domain-containing protein [Rhodocaloribacter litoris]QXD14529.1 DUF58 domain-containing protein [Rhodocaloribacter litoris]